MPRMPNRRGPALFLLLGLMPGLMSGLLGSSPASAHPGDAYQCNSDLDFASQALMTQAIRDHIALRFSEDPEGFARLQQFYDFDAPCIELARYGGYFTTLPFREGIHEARPDAPTESIYIIHDASGNYVAGW